MMKIKIGFSKPKNHPFPLLSWIIRLVQWTPFSHVYLSWVTNHGIEVVCEAGWSGVRLINKKYFDEDNETIKSFTFLITNGMYEKLMKFTTSILGTDYGYLQLVGIGLHRLFRLRKNPFSDGKTSQVCSELVFYFLEEVLTLETGLEADTAGPREIFNFLTDLERGLIYGPGDE